LISRAIAISLQEASSSIHQREEDNDEDDQFQADLQRAIEASEADSKSATNTAPTPIETAPAQPPKSSFLSERALLEKQRLERQKRLRGIVDEEQEEDQPVAKRQRLSLSINKRLDKVVSNSETPSPPNEASSSSPAEQLFWNGELRQTGNMYADPKKNIKPCFHLTDIIGDVSSSVLYYFL
jgi:tyrosyl-DNA phosphodiesterase-1